MRPKSDVVLVPQAASMSDMKHHPSQVFQKLALGPVILANRGRPTAVLLSPEHWHTLIDSIDDLECGIEALQTELAIAKGDDELERLTPTEIEEWLGGNEVP